MLNEIIQKMIEDAIQARIDEIVKTACKAIDSRLKDLEVRIDNNESELNEFDFVEDYQLEDRIHELECDMENRFATSEDMHDLKDLVTHRDNPVDLNDRIRHIENFLLKTLKGFDK